MADCQSGEIVDPSQPRARARSYNLLQAESFTSETHQYFSICKGSIELKWKKLIVGMIPAEDPSIWSFVNGIILF